MRWKSRPVRLVRNKLTKKQLWYNLVMFTILIEKHQSIVSHRIATQGRNKQELYIIYLIKREQHKKKLTEISQKKGEIKTNQIGSKLAYIEA